MAVLNALSPVENEMNPMGTIAYSPDGRYLAMGGVLRMLVLSSEPLAVRFSVAVPVVSIAYSPDGQRLVAAGDFCLYIMDTAYGEVQEHEFGRIYQDDDFPGPRNTRAVAYAPSGDKLAVCCRCGNLYILKAQSMEIIFQTTLSEELNSSQSGLRNVKIAFVSDGQKVALCTILGLWIIDTQDALTRPTKIHGFNNKGCPTKPSIEPHVCVGQDLCAVSTNHGCLSIGHAASGTVVSVGNLGCAPVCGLDFMLQVGQRRETIVPDADLPLSREADQVVEHVRHMEPPAERDESLLQLQADAEWAHFTEDQIRMSMQSVPGNETQHAALHAASSSADEHASSALENVHLLRFGGTADWDDFRQAVLHGVQFLPWREAMNKAGYPCEHSSRAIILVKPVQYPDSCGQLENFELRPFHVVITESLEYLLEEVLATFPCRRRPREKASARQKIMQTQIEPATTMTDMRHVRSTDRPAQETDDDNSADELGFPEICVHRTFLCRAPVFRNPRSVAQSTTEAVHEELVSSVSTISAGVEQSSYLRHYRGINPRRMV
eukprot:gnl/MRDRNA2_/MRDRNA2_83822_c0_seq2.p1 gnl/MRDRNA2_/MRDRNA2_83822_c0~~gnl/MRDRNA2_/MRDRNA2_83822_c0_seq2.p1  ORF type:complete len:619 (-),score=95.23 gnl/MRDRNA2_/MRDRNA2_83822_c0_seq2:182-1831(-)